MTFVVRRAEAEDAPALLRVINAAFAVERSFIEGERTDLGDLRARMRSGEFLVAIEDDLLVGCIYVEIQGRRGFFGMLAVDPARQRGGLGRRMVTAAEELCRARGCSEMRIKVVNLRYELPPYYRALGYAETGETVPWSPEAATKIKVPSHFVVMSKPLA